MGPAQPTPDDERVAAVRAMFEELERRGSTATFSLLDDEVTWDARAIGVLDTARLFRGHDGVREYWRGWLDAWEKIEGWVDGPHYRGHGNQVISWWVSSLIGKGSGVPVHQEAAAIFTFIGRRIVHVALYLSHGEAFRDAGLDGAP